MMLSVGNRREKGLHDRRPVRIGPRRDDLDHRLVPHMRLGQILVVIGEQLLGDEKPVRNENDLKHPDGFALEPQVGVAPRPELRTGNVTLRDIDSSRKAYSAVDDQNLAVVAVVDMAREPGKNDRHEAAHLDARPTSS